MTTITPPQIRKEKENHVFCMDTIKLNTQVEQDFLELAGRFYAIFYQKKYEPYWDSFEIYCEELKNLSYKSVMKMIQIHEKFVLEYKFSPARIAEAGGWSKVAEILPVVKSKKDAEHWLEAAKTKTREHLRDDINEAKTGKEQKKCAHTKAYILCVCPECKYKETIHLDTSVITINGVNYERV